MASLDRDLRRRWSDEPSAPRRPAGPPAPAVTPITQGDWWRFGVAGAVATIGVGAVVALVGFELAGHRIASFIDQPVQGATTLVAGVSCGLLARRSTGKIRTAWALIAGSALISSVVGAVAFVVSELVSGKPAPFPSIADALFLVGQVVAIAGVLSFPSSPARTSGRTRMTIDALVIAISLLYVSWAFGLGGLYKSAHVSFLTASVGLAYPVTDIVAITVLLLVIRRASRTKYSRLGVLLAGLVLKLLADCAYALVFTNAGLDLESGWADVAWIAGFALIALAAWTPVGATRQVSPEEATTLWRMLMPWLGLVGVMFSSTALVVAGRPIDSFLTFPGVALVALLMFSQLVSYRETLTLLGKSKQAEAALQARTNLLNQVVTHAPLGVARIGEDSRFMDANPRLGSLLHAPMKVLMGAPITEFVIREQRADTIAQYRALHDGSLDTVEEEGNVRRADGTPAWIHWTTTAVRKPDGSFDYFLSMAEDVTARHEAQEAAMENLAGLERLNKMKSEFVSMVSHEFRTALVGIQGFSELIRDEELEIAEVKELAGDINGDALRLNRMISEMLDLDRMEAGKIRLEVKPLDLNHILEDAVQHAQVGTEKHQIVTDLDVALPVVCGDSDRLIQVVSNLLSNAIKYSPDGGEIRVTSRAEGATVHVSVQDHGLGIPAEFINRVFGRYERFESNRTGKVAGTGLGLAISRQIVELHAGKMWVESAGAGSGSTFHFTIPFATPPGPAV